MLSMQDDRMLHTKIHLCLCGSSTYPKDALIIQEWMILSELAGQFSFLDVNNLGRERLDLTPANPTFLR